MIEPTFADLLRDDFDGTIRAMREVWTVKKWYERRPKRNDDTPPERIVAEVRS